MILGIQASRSFDDYPVFMRAMGTVLADINGKDEDLYIYSAGPAKLNSMAIEFINVTERSLKSQNIKVKLRKVPVAWFESYMSDIDTFAYFCRKKEPASHLVKLADDKELNPFVYRFAHDA